MVNLKEYKGSGVIHKHKEIFIKALERCRDVDVENLTEKEIEKLEAYDDDNLTFGSEDSIKEEAIAYWFVCGIFEEKKQKLEQERDKLIDEKKALKEIGSNYKKKWIDLEEKNEEKEVLIEEMKKNLEIEKEIAKVHYEAIEVCDNWYTKQPGCLKEKLGEKSQEAEEKSRLLSEVREEVEEEKIKSKNLRQELEEERKISKEIREQFEEMKIKNLRLEEALKILPKKQSKSQQLKTKIKTKLTKFQQLIRKNNTQKQELIARIEVKTN